MDTGKWPAQSSQKATSSSALQSSQHNISASSNPAARYPPHESSSDRDQGQTASEPLPSSSLDTSEISLTPAQALQSRHEAAERGAQPGSDQNDAPARGPSVPTSTYTYKEERKRTTLCAPQSPGKGGSPAPRHELSSPQDARSK